MTQLRLFAALALPLVFTTASAFAETGLSVGSSADELESSFSSGPMTTSLGPVNKVQRSFPPAYAAGSSLASYAGSTLIPPFVAAAIPPAAAKFSADLNKLNSSVISKGTQLDFITASGTASVGRTHLGIASVGDPVSIDYLDISAAGASANANFTTVFPAANSVVGSASLSTLVVGGALLGGQTVKYSGQPAANTVLYQSTTVTVVANEQTIAGVVSCGPTCRFNPATITVHALSVHLTNAIVQGSKVTGDILLGNATAF